MNGVYKAFTYLLRKKGKTISLFLVIFVIAVFLISCFGVLRASESLEREIRTSLGAAFYLRANTEVSMHKNGEAEVKENKVSIKQKEIDEIMQTKEIKYCNPINYGFVKSDAIEFIPGEKHTKESNMGKVTALRFSALAFEFLDETAVLMEGKHITEADQRKILISEQLANENEISVGDTLTLTHAGLTELDGAYLDKIPVKTAFVQVEVSGIYKLHVKDNSVKPTAGIAENQIYASLDVLDELHESEAGIYTGEVDFYITDPAKLSQITRDVQLMQEIDWTTHFIRSNDFQYSKIADQLSTLGRLAKLLFVLVSVVSTSVLTLLLIMRMRGRVRETGILLAAGWSKGKIIAGFLLEVQIVAAAALILSYFVSLGITQFFEQKFLYGLQPNLLNEETLIAGVNHGTKKSYDYTLRGTELLLIYFGQWIVIVVSTLLSLLMIMRLKPKEILSKMS